MNETAALTEEILAWHTHFCNASLVVSSSLMAMSFLGLVLLFLLPGVGDKGDRFTTIILLCALALFSGLFCLAAKVEKRKGEIAPRLVVLQYEQGKGHK